jgi:hypothetical protein
MPNRIEARSAKAALTNATGRLPLLAPVLDSTGSDNPDDALWYSLPDIVASVLLNNGQIPNIIDAFRIESRGKLSGLKPTKLRGQIDVDPGSKTFSKS